MLSIWLPATQSYFKLTRLSSLSKTSILLSHIQRTSSDAKFYSPWIVFIELWDKYRLFKLMHLSRPSIFVSSF